MSLDDAMRVCDTAAATATTSPGAVGGAGGAGPKFYVPAYPYLTPTEWGAERAAFQAHLEPEAIPPEVSRHRILGQRQEAAAELGNFQRDGMMIPVAQL